MPDQAMLARRYRRLLVTYPRAYRKERGAEIVDTMLEAAPAGRTGPTFREAMNLAGSGLRCRLGRPQSRIVVVLSLVTALMAGVVGAAAFGRLAWQTAAPLPSDRAVRQVFDLAAPGANSGNRFSRDAFLFGYPWETSWWNGVTQLISLGGFDEYGPGSVGQSAYQKRVGDPHRYATSAAASLGAAGWQVAPDSLACQGAPCSSERFTEFNARRADTVVQYDITPGWAGSDMFFIDEAGDSVSVTVAMYRARPALVVPAEIAGGLLAALLGWLLFGWVSRCTWRRRFVIQAPTYLLYCALLLFWTPPILFLPFVLWAEARPLPNSWGLPTSELFVALTFPGLGWPLCGVVAAVLLTVVAALCRPRETVGTSPASSLRA